MTITFLGTSLKTYPHVKALVEKQNKTEAERALLRAWGARGNASQKRQKKACVVHLPLLPVGNLDQNQEFPDHRVLYRGPHFVLLKAKPKRPTKVAQSQETTGTAGGLSEEDFEALMEELHEKQLEADARAHHLRNLAGAKHD